ncbi:nuclear transport factor 2 family protein [Arcticibacter sp. MXS-1]|uniref:nuclear transport factor 2 family protein n=1 Tax=Arcticibacter sp. MXS-1 TaxID=3341726 RepID=UPI0035A9049D
MRKIAPVVCLLLMMSYHLVAQTKSEKEVAAAVETLTKAMIDGNRSALEAVASKNLSYGHSGGKVEDKATFVESIASGKSDFVTIDLTNQTVQVSGNTAIVRHHLAASTNDGGKPGNVSLNILLVFQKQQGKWLLLARQAVKAQ